MNPNPLKQYFRRPALYLKLPSGIQGYEPGVIDIPENGDLPIYPMTAIDEITARTPDALFNGVAVVELIKSCAPNVKDPWHIFSTDLDAILIGIKAASNGDKLEIESECPKCKENSKYDINLTAMLLDLKSGDYTQELNVDELYVKFRPLIYKEMNDVNLQQFEIQQSLVFLDTDTDETKANRNKIAMEKVTTLTINVLANTIEYIKTPVGIVREKEFFIEFLRNCDRNSYIKIRDYATSLKEKTEMPPLDIICVNCKNPYKSAFSLNVTDFFG
jgi:hypothetical protein